MKKIFSLFFILVCCCQIFAQKQTRALNSRSDTLDIIDTKIHIFNINKTAKTISAFTELKIKSKLNNVQNIVLDLEGYTVDSVQVNNVAVAYIFNSPLLVATLNNTLQTNDSINLIVYYHGLPPTDAQWGGFYFTGVFAFNMGVGFITQPHNFGRSLFPCFDNFVERTTFEFNIETELGDMAVCSGVLLDSNSTATHTNWHWKLNENIPSYLAGIAIAPYIFVKKNINGINGITEAWIACLPTDSNKVNASFAKLQESFTMLESRFGAYAWPRIGYSLVPFGGGAMEHAANIHIGSGFIDGTLNYQTLIAHELSHHWFGNLVTCRTAQDMWLNEGFASYCELLHTEYISGYTAYLNAYKTLHFNMLSKAHVSDDGYRSISGMDSNYTYGTTVYSKGSDVLHTLRSYLGDSLFFNGLKNYLNTNKFKDVNTNTLTNSLNTFSGKNISNYMDAWVNQPGFANFTIDSVQKRQNGITFDVTVFVRQRKHKNNMYYKEVPLPINFYKKDFTYQTSLVTMSNQCGVFAFNLPFNPEFICLDANETLSDASTWDVKNIISTGIKTFDFGKARAIVKNIVNASDSSLLRMEHHWVAPDRFKTPQGTYVLNDVRYWRVDGINLPNIKGSLGFLYNASVGNNFQDSTWLKNNEDSLKLFYRKDATQDWLALNDSLVTGNKLDKIGIIYAKEIIAGDYAIGIKRANYVDTLTTDASDVPCAFATNFSTTEFTEKRNLFVLFPNPADTEITIISNVLVKNNAQYVIYNAQGKTVAEGIWKQNLDKINISLRNFANGIYSIAIITNEKTYNLNFVVNK